MENIREDRILKAYDLINDYANSNVGLQGISGLVGFPLTIAVDGAVIFTHYAPMINKIRQLYELEPFSKEYLTDILKNISKDIVFDLLVDKVVGQVPIIGVYFNAISAKSFTWRLGILFSILSSSAEKDMEYIKKTVELIRNIFPQKDVFKFTKPDYQSFKKIMMSIDNDDVLFRDRIDEALKAFTV